jgi:hypothetical protein
MAFKMKGSAFKLGGVQGTSGHRSALKQVEVSPLKHSGDKKHWHGPRYLPTSYGGKNVLEEFKQWKIDNPEGNPMEWINNWKNETNDPTMPSAQQAKELVLPKWAQEKYGLKEGAVLGNSWNTLIPSSGGSHHSRIVGMESGLSAAVPHEKHDSEGDNRTAEQKRADEMNYKQIVANAGGEDSEDYLEWKKGQEEIELNRKRELDTEQLLAENREEALNMDAHSTEGDDGELMEPIEDDIDYEGMEIEEEEFKDPKGQKYFEKHGYNPFHNPDVHKENLIAKLGKKEGKKKFKTWKKKNPNNWDKNKQT